MSEFGRQPLLTEEEEQKLKARIEPMWANGATGTQIAQALNFGVLKIEVDGKLIKNPYAKILPQYFYYYRRKLELPLHGEPRFRKDDPNYRDTRYKIRPEEIGLMSRDVFVSALNEKLSNIADAHAREQRSFLIVLYKTGLRAREIYERVISDFTLTDQQIIIHLLRLKKLSHKLKDEPAIIKRSSALEEEVVNWLNDKAWRKKVPARDQYNHIIKSAKGRRHFVMNKRPWNIGRTSVQRWVTDTFKDAYAHFYRFNDITLTSKIPGVSTSDLKAKTFLSMRALENYIITPAGTAEEINRLREEHEDDLNALVTRLKQAKTRMK
jgi:integrase